MSTTDIYKRESMLFTQNILAACHKVLFFENHPANLNLVENLLARRVDLQLLKAINDCMGIAIAQAHQAQVILMDINLPDMSRFEILEISRTYPVIVHIPVIALSSDAFQHQIKKGIRAGFFRYMTKSYKITDLMDAMDESIYFSLRNHH